MPDAISTRGQHLPKLLKTRSNISLYDARAIASPRKSSIRTGSVGGYDDSDLERGSKRQPSRISGDGRGIDLDVGFDPPEPPASFPIARSPMRLDRRGSSSALWNPQMRSQRLIGNSNPRYEW